MITKLNYIQDWTGLARRANWSVAGLAGLCGVSERTVRRYIRKNMRQAPKTWLAGQRLKEAKELLCDGSSVKEVASLLGYAYPSTFAREFKKQTGRCPSSVAKRRVAGG